MVITQQRLIVKLTNKELLIGMMKHHDYNVRTLAEEVNRRVKKKDKNLSCSRSLIGHLTSGNRNSCGSEVSKAIEDTLQIPRGTLFAPSIVPVTREVGPSNQAH